MYFACSCCFVLGEFFGNSENSVWEETYPEIQYEDFKYPEKLDSELIRVLHGIVREVGGGLIVHSDYRPSKRENASKKESATRVINSYHKFGIAIDFRLDTYIDLSKKERLYVYYQKNKLLENFLKKHGLFENVGLGVYPFARKPFWHLDIRGRKARWCRNKRNRYVGYDDCKNMMEKKIALFKSTLRILNARLWAFGKDGKIQHWERFDGPPLSAEKLNVFRTDEALFRVEPALFSIIPHDEALLNQHTR